LQITVCRTAGKFLNQIDDAETLDWDSITRTSCLHCITIFLMVYLFFRNIKKTCTRRTMLYWK